MRFTITGDVDNRSGVQDVLNAISNNDLDDYFDERCYDDSGLELFVVLMCRDPSLKFSQRMRYSRGENVLYMDIMLDFERMRLAELKMRKVIIAEEIGKQVPKIIAKYDIDFDSERFSKDLGNWFATNFGLDEAK